MLRNSLYLGTLALLALCALASVGLAQESAAPAVSNGGDLSAVWRQITRGGWAMIPLALCALATLYLIGNGILRTSRKRLAPPGLNQTVKALFRQGDYAGAYTFCKENPSPLTNVLRVGISLLGDGKEIAEEGLMVELAKEDAKIRRYGTHLFVIAIGAPMLGILGTLTGLIRVLANQSAPDLGASSVSAGLADALVPAASGLVIALPAFVACCYLRNRAALTILHIRDSVSSAFRKMPYDTLASAEIGGEEL